MHGVTVVLVVFGGINSALSGDGVRAARRILVAEGFHLIPEFSEGRGSRGPCETGADDNDLKLAAVGRVDELGFELVILPLLFERSGGNPGIEGNAHCFRDAWKG